ncbi:MAG: DNA mismatch repair endonuclease MutL [Proteobacteria bacterium]|nr:DNA mismatch repair endonuclease MutL [Pseudomonadota bacterium]
MTKIHVLSQALSNQIAAGEVLERSASAVKELVENSLDAGATAIEIEIDDGGKKHLMVSDNGCGMTREDVQLSILRHATSKIHTSSDLASISTMGFRGEALASMAAVSRMTITTQRPEDEMGTFLRVEGTEVLECRDTAAPAGTQIVLDDLFFNTPARLKFLKTTATEVRRVYEVVEQFGLSCPEVSWKLTVDGRVKCDWPSHGTLRDRALAVFGRSLYENLFPIEHTVVGDIVVEGLFCSPEYTSTGTGRLYTYVNRRIVKDKTINSAISQSYREFLHGKQPCVVLFLTIPLDFVDVNVHPTKHEVRFKDQEAVFRTVYRALRHSLEKTPWIRSTSETLTSSVPLTAAKYFEMLPDAAFRTPEDNLHRDFGLAPQYPGPERKPVAEDAGDADAAGQPDASASRAPCSAPFCDSALTVFDGDTSPAMSSGRFECAAPGEALNGGSAAQPAPAWMLQAVRPAQPEPEQKQLPLGDSVVRQGYFSNLRYIGQHALTYLICSDGDSLVIIDQHAAHERINYERLRDVSNEILPKSSQHLLFPILLQLDTRLSDVLEEYADFFEKLGFQIDAIGDHSHAIRSVPDCLKGYDYAAMIREALTDLAETGRSMQIEQIRDDVIATMACHRSIRSGYKMSPEEVRELFRQMDATAFRSNCPHGRPVHFVCSASELEKRFLRVGYRGLGDV